MRNSLGSTGIRLDARADVVPYGLKVLLQIAADDLYYKRVNGAPVDRSRGRLRRAERERMDARAARWRYYHHQGKPQQAVMPSLVRFSKTWSIEPDTTLVRLIVRDRMTGRFGVLDMPVGNQVKR